MKELLFILSLIGSITLFSQDESIRGVVKDSASLDPMISAHVLNSNKRLVTYTNSDGEFKIPALVGDTLVISNVGYQTLAWIVEKDWDQGKVFLLPTSTIYLDEVVVGKFPTYTRFKEQVMNVQVEDSSYVVPGVVVTKAENPDGALLTLNGGLTIRGPFSRLYNAFSKKAKEKRKFKKILSKKPLQDKANLKFTRSWVSQTTKLKGDTLTSFIEYCNFSIEYIAEMPSYIIYEDMMALLPEFLSEYED